MQTKCLLWAETRSRHFCYASGTVRFGRMLFYKGFEILLPFIGYGFYNCLILYFCGYPIKNRKVKCYEKHETKDFCGSGAGALPDAAARKYCTCRTGANRRLRELKRIGSE